jgi:hypothetical protein
MAGTGHRQKLGQTFNDTENQSVKNTGDIHVQGSDVKLQKESAAINRPPQETRNQHNNRAASHDAARLWLLQITACQQKGNLS